MNKAMLCVSHPVVSDSLPPHRLFPAGLLCPWNSPGKKEYRSGLPFPSPGTLSHLGIKPGLPHCRQILYCLSHQGSPNKGINPDNCG